MSEITVVELKALIDAGQAVALIDVRTPEEFQEVHAEPAANFPLDTLDPAGVLRSRKTADGPLYMICRSGGRSSRACELFQAAGFPSAVNVEGGTLAWIEANYPVIRGEIVANPGPTACTFRPKPKTV